MEAKILEREQLVKNFSVPLVDSSVYEFEKFNYPFWREWMEERWHWSLYFTATYVLLIVFGKVLMKTREPPRFIGKFLIYWNLALTLFSVLAFSRSLPELTFFLGRNHGFHLSLCTREFMTQPHVFWEWIGTLSKVAELFDTMFIVLKKQNLIFLHWYHHASVMVYTWYSFGATDPAHRWFMPMNYFVHSIMYSYYLLRSMKVKMPRNLAMTITTLQLLQMVVGVTVNIYSLYAINVGWDCVRPLKNIYAALGMYFTYLVLFANFFHSTYFRSTRHSHQEKKLQHKTS